MLEKVFFLMATSGWSVILSSLSSVVSSAGDVVWFRGGVRACGSLEEQ